MAESSSSPAPDEGGENPSDFDLEFGEESAGNAPAGGNPARKRARRAPPVEDEMDIVFDDEEETPPPVETVEESDFITESTGDIPAATEGGGEEPPSMDEISGEPSDSISARSKAASFAGRYAPKSPLEWVSLGAVALLLLLGLLVFQNAVSNAFTPSSETEPARSVPRMVKGEFAEIAIEEVYWRDRRKGDPGDPSGKILPEMKLRIASGGKSGYIQALFKNEHGKITGDSITYRMENGKFIETGSAEAAFIGTGGFTNRVYFAEYQEFDGLNRWSITLKESPDNRNWNQAGQIAFFEIPSRFSK